MEKKIYNPLVSIIIPVYKGELFMREAIDSALNQTYKNIEVIVVNDGSPDDGKTDMIAKSYGDSIRYFYKENGGVSSALNYGISKMRGEWFSWLSHDDLYTPDKIEKQIEAAEKAKEKVCVVRCNTSSIDAKGNPIVRPQRKVEGLFSAKEMFKMHSLKEVGLYGCTLLIHKNILNECGEFDENLRTVQDEDYWTRIMFKGFFFISIKDTLVKIRVHGNQMTKILENLFDKEREVYANKVFDYYNWDKTKNRENLLVFICKEAKEKRKKIEKQLITLLKDESTLSLIENIKIKGYELWGSIYSFAKKAYRWINIRGLRK